MMEQQEIICLGVANRAVDKGVQGVLWGRAPPLQWQTPAPLPQVQWQKRPPYLKWGRAPPFLTTALVANKTI